jgi:hypothetical protein
VQGHLSTRHAFERRIRLTGFWFQTEPEEQVVVTVQTASLPLNLSSMVANWPHLPASELSQLIFRAQLVLLGHAPLIFSDSLNIAKRILDAKFGAARPCRSS